MKTMTAEDRSAVRKAAYYAPQATFVALDITERLMGCNFGNGAQDCGIIVAH